MTTIAAEFNTGEFHGYNIKYSPFKKNVIACAASENYGISGRGRLFVLEIVNGRSVKQLYSADYKDGLFDVTWSECDSRLIVTSCGDGSIQIWDVTKSHIPINNYKFHDKEVYSVDWNPKNAYPYILSASWDRIVKVWDPFAAKFIAVFAEHTDQVYEACWSYHIPEIFASVSGDKCLKLWDHRMPNSCSTYLLDSEVLCCDWAKTDRDILAAGTVDGKIYEFDMRKSGATPLFELSGHEYAIRQLRFSHFERGKLATVSYDFSTKFWNWNVPYPLESLECHSEFVYGLDFSPLRKGECCDCAWDSKLFVYLENDPA